MLFYCCQVSTSLAHCFTRLSACFFFLFSYSITVWCFSVVYHAWKLHTTYIHLPLRKLVWILFCVLVIFVAWKHAFAFFYQSVMHRSILIDDFDVLLSEHEKREICVLISLLYQRVFIIKMRLSLSVFVLKCASGKCFIQTHKKTQ